MRDEWIKKFGVENAYNKHCEYLTITDGVASCDIHMDLTFCGFYCAYATNNPLATKVKRKGKRK